MEEIKHSLGRPRINLDSCVTPALKWTCVKSELVEGYVNLSSGSKMVIINNKKKRLYIFYLSLEKSFTVKGRFCFYCLVTTNKYFFYIECGI